MELAQKTILITGASRGIGKYLAEDFSDKKANVILVSENEQELIVAFESLEGSKHKYYVCDLSDPLQISNLIKELQLEYKKLDVLINNAAIGIYKKIEDVEPEDWMDSFAINVTAPFVLTKELLPLFKESKDAVIINMGSKCGKLAIPERAVYCATKFALRGLSLTLAKELKDQKIIVCLVTLGSTMTEFGPLTIEDKNLLQTKGKEYLTVQEVSEKILSMLESGIIPGEIEIYPK